MFRLIPEQVNPEMVIAFGLFTAMVFANVLNWTIGGVFMRSMGFVVKVPKQRLMPVILLVTLTAIYSQQPTMFAIIVTLVFGLIGYLMRKFDISVLPFVIAFILANNLEAAMRQAFSATGNDPWFLFASPISIAFILVAILVVVLFSRGRKQASGKEQELNKGTVT